MGSILITALVFMLMVCVLVAAHEYGHFLFARIFRMDVEEFAIGLFRPYWTWMRKNGTNFTFRLWPLGGFVRIKGMVAEEDGQEVHVENGFYSKPAYQRFLVLVAGPVFSIGFGVLILAGVFAFSGIVHSVNQPIVGMIVPGSAADIAKLRPDDRIVAVDNQPMHTFYDLIKVVRVNAGTKLDLTVQRNGKVFHQIAIPVKGSIPTAVIDSDLNPTDDLKVQGLMGWIWKRERSPVAFGSALSEAVETPIKVGENLFSIIRKPSKAPDEVGGIGTLAAVTHEAAREGLSTVIYIAGMLSISLGFMNLLPIVPLDGGQMVIALAEMLRRGRRLSLAVQNALTTVGVVLVFTMVVGALYLDGKRFIPGMSEKRTSPAVPQKTPRQ